MPRKGEVPKRKVLPDPKYTDAPADLRRRITGDPRDLRTDFSKEE